MDYNKLLEKARKAYAECVTGAEKRRLESIFPELNESEDEKIWKTLREIIIDYDPNNEILIKEVGISQKQFLAWLEKQGEQKPLTQYNYVKFREGDIVQKITGDKDIVTIAEVDIEAEEYKLTNTGFIPFKYEHLWHIVEQKPAWSEEDEEELYLTISLLDKLKEEAYTIDCENCINWLKSLKPQPHWKPTDEQIDALDKVYKTHGADCECRHIILGLLNELKKL